LAETVKSDKKYQIVLNLHLKDLKSNISSKLIAKKIKKWENY